MSAEARQVYRGRLLQGTAVEVSVAQGVIQSVTPVSEDAVLPLLAPPLVDLQHNGALGVDYTQLDDAEAGLDKVAEVLRKSGVGRAFPTVITADFQRTHRSLRAIDECLSRRPDLAQLFPGIFYEGNFMSADEGWRGVHNMHFMSDPSWDVWQRLQEAAGGRIRVFNIDPERPGALATIRQAVAAGLRVAMGHCGPAPEAIRAAVDAGADLVTHFGNGMPPQIHRHRNPLWTWLADKRVKLSLIADGHHLPGDLIRAVANAKGPKGYYLVSDASSASGNPPGDYGDYVIEEDGCCHAKDQEILAGAWHQLNRGVELLCELGWPLEAAWSQASLAPAEIMGLELPPIEPGRTAEFVVARYGAEGLTLHPSWG